MLAKLLKWLIFTVVVALVPFGIVALDLWDKGDNLFAWSVLWPHGELMLVSTALAADALGDLIASDRPSGSLKIAAGGGCLVVLIITIAGYVLSQTHPDYKP